MKRVLIAAGGTGGHIYPGLAIAEIIQKKSPETEIVFIGSYVGMEKNIIPQAGYPIDYIRARGFERSLSLETFSAIKGIFESIHDAKKVLSKYAPEIVIGTGGFTSAMLLREASKKGYHTLIHEQNAFPGRANKMLGKRVDRIAVSFDEGRAYFPEEKVFLSGNPVRESFKQLTREACREKLKLKDHQKMIVAMGGSQGAESINRAVLDLIKANCEKEELVFYHMTGKSQFDWVSQQIEQMNLSEAAKERVHILAYSNEMDSLLKACDLAIARSGAMSVAEFAITGTPTILIPFPKAAENHQEFNARVLTEKGAGILVLDADLTGDYLIKTVGELIHHKETLEKMRKQAYTCAIEDAPERIFNHLEDWL